MKIGKSCKDCPYLDEGVKWYTLPVNVFDKHSYWGSPSICVLFRTEIKKKNGKYIRCEDCRKAKKL